MNNGNTIVDVAYISEVSCLAVNDGFINDPERVTAGAKAWSIIPVEKGLSFSSISRVTYMTS